MKIDSTAAAAAAVVVPELFHHYYHSSYMAAASPNTPSHHSLWELFFLFCRRGLSSFCSSHKSQSKKPEKEVWKLIVQCCSTYGRYLRYIQRYFAFPFRLSICNSPHSFRIRVRQVTKRFTLLQYDCTAWWPNNRNNT